MIIGIDGNEANVSDRVGVNTYAYQLIKNLKNLQLKGENEHTLIVYLKDKPIADMPQETENFKYKVLPAKKLWIITRLTPYLLKNPDKIDIIFSPSHYSVPISHIPKVVSIMDLGYLENSAHFSKKTFWQLKYWTAKSISTSKCIIAISSATKKDIVRHYKVDESKVFVTHLGYDSALDDAQIGNRVLELVKKRYSIVSDYILYLGTLKPSKNIEKLIEAFSLVVAKYPNINLVIAGKKGWMYESFFNMVQKMALTDRIIFTGFVPERDKAALIKGARVFAIPSLWEGFGIDAVTAMKIGVPVVASNVGSLPEVVGETGLLVDPRDAQDIADKLIEVLKASYKKYNRMIEAGKLQAKDFSWEKCALETLRILENAKR